MIIFTDLTMISSSDVFTNKAHIAPRLSLVNVPGLNKLLRSEVFISKDRQLRAVHLILDYEPLSRTYPNTGQVIRAGDPRLARIDVSVPGFLARRDLPPVELPLQRSPRKVAAPREEIASSRLSFKAEIDRFHSKEGEEEQAQPIIHLLDSEEELDRHSATHSPKLIIARVDSNSIEKEEMSLYNKKTRLHDLLKNRGAGLQGTLGSKPPPTLPPPPPFPMTELDLLLIPNSKKKRKE